MWGATAGSAAQLNCRVNMLRTALKPSMMSKVLTCALCASCKQQAGTIYDTPGAAAVSVLADSMHSAFANGAPSTRRFDYVAHNVLQYADDYTQC
jgi:hypothetical protein